MSATIQLPQGALAVRPYTGGFRQSWGQGSVIATGAELRAIFGEPGQGDGHKVAWQWDLLFSDGTYATIYDWKVCNTYDSNRGWTPVQLLEFNHDWHVGGTSPRARELVQQFVTGYRETGRGTARPKVLPARSSAFLVLVMAAQAALELLTDPDADQDQDAGRIERVTDGLREALRRARAGS